MYQNCNIIFNIFENNLEIKRNETFLEILIPKFESAAQNDQDSYCRWDVSSFFLKCMKNLIFIEKEDCFAPI